MTRAAARRLAACLPVALAAAILFAGCRSGDGDKGHPGDQPGPGSAVATAARWLCPMHPTYTSDHQGACPICGMDLVEATAFAATQGGAAGGLPGLAALELDDRAVQLAGVRTQPAAVQPWRRVIRAVGTVVVDETRQYSVQARMSGWIETLAVAAVGERVARGGPLLTIYSPELVATQEELLRSRALAASATDAGTRAAAGALAEAARRRLRLLGVGEEFVAGLEQTGEVARAVPLCSPAGGIVTRRDAYPGMAVMPGQELLQVSDVSSVWLDARFYEYEARHVTVGRAVTVRPAHEPGLEVAGVIDYVYPTVDEATRTLRARVVLANDFGGLRPGMYADVLLEAGQGEALAIPDDAILDTGRRQVVFVALGGGRFVPREVVIGDRAEGLAQVLEGLEPGELVVVKSAFLLDSESRIRAALLPPPGSPAAGGHEAAHDPAHDPATGATR